MTREEELLAMLKRLEWLEMYGAFVCPICDQKPYKGHLEDCELKKLIG